MKFRMLCVDLTRGKISKKELKESYIENWIGGRGLGAKLLSESNPRAEPLSEKSHIFVLASPLVGLLPSVNRIWFVSVSPLTGCYVCSSAGDFFAGELRKAGFDGIRITGRSSKPVYLSVINGKAKLNNAGALWRKSTEAATKILKKKHGGEVASIGIAGENLVRFACVNVGVRQAGRGGLGAVMGFKKLKAIVAKGSRAIPFADNPEIKELNRECLKEILKTGKGWHEKGTLELMEYINEADIWPSHNWRKSSFDKKLYWNRFKKHVTGHHSCFACPISCGRNMKSRYGAGGDGPEYETVWAFGPECSNDDADIIIQANRLCDLYGMDTITTGSVIGWLRECSERGLVDYYFLKNEQILELIGDIARREGIGDMLALGTRDASQLVAGSEGFAVNQAGMELPAYDPRGVWGMLLSYTFGPRHGCHLKAWTISTELKMGLKGRTSTKGKARMVSDMLDERAFLDSSCTCSFIDDAIVNQLTAKAMSVITGRNYDTKKLNGMGKRIVDLERSIDLKRGFGKEQDTLPSRIIEDYTVIKGKKIRVGKENFNKMKREFYKIRGW